MASVTTSRFFSSVGSCFRERNHHSSNRVRVSCSSSSSTVDPYNDASKSEVKKAFRKLTLKAPMNYYQEVSVPIETYETQHERVDKPMKGSEDQEWEFWKEWKGWEGAWIQDSMKGSDDPECEFWKEWKGWEGAWIQDSMKGSDDPECEFWKEWKGWEGAWIQDYWSLKKINKNMATIDHFRGMSLSIETFDKKSDEPIKIMEDPEWEMWKECNGWEGAWIQDNSL